MLPYIFDFLVTSIEVKEGKKVDGDEFGPDAMKVEFSGAIEEEKDDRDMVYLVNVEDIGEGGDKWGNCTNKFSAIQVSAETFVERLAATGKKVLACIHGFQAEPLAWMTDTCKVIQDHKDFHHLVLPIIWPSVGNVYWSHDMSYYYGKEKRIAKTAGKAFNAITAFGTSNISLSLMCHSIGNRVLLSFAEAQSTDPSKKFDQIFMVAPDVWEEVFNRRVIDGEWDGDGKWRDAGLKLCRMVKSKIHIFHIEYDGALKMSSLQNGRGTQTRLGRFGKKAQNDDGRLHVECDPILVDKDMAPHWPEVKKMDTNYHSYQKCDTCIKYYIAEMNK